MPGGSRGFPVSTRTLLQRFVALALQDGRGLIQILEKQLGRVGCTLADVVSASTDGGGENIGKEGLHASLQQMDLGYVRRRGLEHLSWRVCDAGLAAAGELVREYKALANYLHDGITWTRLQAIATLPENLGGLGLFGRQTAQFHSFFSPAPPHVIDDRPETDMRLLRCSWMHWAQHYILIGQAIGGLIMFLLVAM